MNLKNLISSCRRSKAAYDEHHTVNRLHGHIKTYDGTYKKKRDAQGFLYYPGKKTIYVTYRGTVNMSDIFDNIDIRHQSFFDSQIKVHKGFYEQFFSIEEDITKDIKDIVGSKDISHIVFSGHSLGGALAILSSPYYGKMFNRQYNIITHTFGTVPVGNGPFVNWFINYVDHNVRVENENDIVPTIPIHDKFYHVPNGILLKADGTFETDYETKLYSYIDLLRMVMHKETWENINNEHSCDLYISNLKKIRLSNLDG